jgi:hypothetical protein
MCSACPLKGYSASVLLLPLKIDAESPSHHFMVNRYIPLPVTNNSSKNNFMVLRPVTLEEVDTVHHWTGVTYWTGRWTGA